MTIPDDKFSSDRPTREQILKAVASVYGRPYRAVIGENRMKNNTFPRQVAAYLMSEVYGYSYHHSGRAIGRDHTTVLYAKRKIIAMIEAGDEDLATKIEAILALLALLAGKEPVPVVREEKPKPQVSAEPESDPTVAFILDDIRLLRRRGWSLKSICRRLEVEPRFVAPLIGVHLEELVHANGGVTVRSPERSAVE